MVSSPSAIPNESLNRLHSDSVDDPGEIRAVLEKAKSDGVRLESRLNLVLEPQKARIVEVDADLAWQPWRNFGLGIGIRYFNTNMEARILELNGEFDFEYFGPVIYVQTTF